MAEKVSKADAMLGRVTAKALAAEDPLWAAFEPRDPVQTGIACFLAYLRQTLGALGRANYLQEPLRTVGQQEQLLLPTMPQDDTVEVIKALQNDSTQYRTAPAIYRCHKCKNPFAIDDCGRPTVSGTCPQCGTAVGGQGYNKFIGGDQKDVQGALDDQTRPGHILGAARDFARAEAQRALGAVQGRHRLQTASLFLFLY